MAFIILVSPGSARGQCPWQREVSDLQSACLCAYNLGQELSVQCDQVDFPVLVNALDRYARNSPLDLLYVNNSTITKLDDDIFRNLEIHNIQLSGCKIRTISPHVFRGQEEFLKNLNMQDNELTELPVASLRGLVNLQLLDLSKNRITAIADDSFSTLRRLATLKLSDQNITLSEGALRGLEDSLKNLNLKGTRQKIVPDCIRGMKTLAFLDLSQNALRDLPGRGVFQGLASLTALNLERNLIQSLNRDAFAGIRGTLSSLSLLNNLLPEYPTEAIGQLKELRVLDIGFNLLTELPDDAFIGNPSITLLALDGNPLSTVQLSALAHLQKSLRGLSLGGRFLHCDCRLRWVTEWIRNGDLQVTSRERNPQFCGSPPRFRARGFYSIQPEELTCTDRHGVVQPVLNNEPFDEEATIGVVDSLKPTKPTQATTTTTTKKPTTTRIITTTTTTTTTKAPSTAKSPSTTPSTTNTTPTTTPSTTMSSTESTTKTSTTTTVTTKANEKPVSTRPSWKQNNQQPQQRPPLVLGFPPGQRGAIKRDDSDEVMVKNAFRQDNSVIIQWDSDTSNILGFRVVYRLFGDKSFKQGPPLEASEREFKIKNVPPQECIIVCVISLEEVNATPDTVPHAQCREVRTVGTAASSMDKITIAASAAICGTIVIAVIVFVAASRRRSRKMAHSLHNGQHQDMIGAKNGLPIAGLPVNCCISTPSPAGPLSSLATLSAFNNHKVEDWDQVSGYSGRSIPRPRVYPLENNIADDLRSHVSHFSNSGGHGPMSAGSQNTGKGGKARSLADGQSQHSFSNHSGRYLATNAFPSNLVNSRPELRQSRQSLTAASDRMSRSSYPASMHNVTHSGNSQGSRRARPRSRSRDQHNHPHNRPGSRYSTAGSTHTLNNYCDTSDNWTDHDMDIYMARNPTTRGGLVPL